MKKIFNQILFVLLFILSATNILYAQDDEANEPVRDIWTGGQLIDNQTTLTPMKGAIDFVIQHRMDQIKDIDDLYGLYAPSNIRLGLSYGVTEKLSLGFGSEKNNKLQEFFMKYAILKQTNSGSSPFDLTFYGNFTLDAREKALFHTNYKSIDRLSYFAELIVARKVNENLSLELSSSFSHFNKVDSTVQNDALGVSLGGRYKLIKDFTFIFEYNQGVFLKTMRYFQDIPTPDLSFGMEVGTGSHAFQLFATTCNNIVNQVNYVYNKTTKFLIGFNISVKF